MALALALTITITITRFAATTVCLTQLAAKTCSPGDNFEFSCCCPGKVGEQNKKERRSTAFLRDKLAPLIFKLRWPLIVFTTTLFIGGVVVTATLFTDGEAQNWTDGHQLQRLADIQSDEFGDPDDPKPTVTLIYGLADRSVEFPSSIDIFQPFRDGWDEKFELKFNSGVSYGPELQEKIVADCEALRANSEITYVAESGDGESYCLLNDLKEYAGTAFPYADEKKLRAALDDFYSSEKYAQLTSTYSGYRTSTNFVIDSKGTSMTLWQSFNTTIPIDDLEISVEGIQPYYDQWRSAVDKQCDAGVVLTQQGYPLFVLMTALQGSMWSKFSTQMAASHLAARTYRPLLRLRAALLAQEDEREAAPWRYGALATGAASALFCSSSGGIKSSSITNIVLALVRHVHTM